MERKLGIILDYLDDDNYIKALHLIKNAGFKCFFSGFYDYETVKIVKDESIKIGLDFEFIHASFKNINSMWTIGDEYKKIYNDMIEAIDSASLNDIKTVIIHVSSGWNPPEVSDCGLKRYDSLVEYAKEKNVIIAFENLRKIGNLAYLMDRYEKYDNVRFCYDSGHEFCYTPKCDWISLFNDKLICTHIHDNHGRDLENLDADGDEHILPLDGLIDYKYMMDRLRKVNYNGSLILENFKGAKEEYKKMSDEEFTKLCYERIKKVSEM